MTSTNKRTTDLSAIRAGRPYTWGEVVAIHHIGRYDIVEHHPWRQDGVVLLSGNPDPDRLEFNGYLDGRDLAWGAESLDAALAHCIVAASESDITQHRNTRADIFFMRMIGRG